jgi:hypothetical protein
MIYRLCSVIIFISVILSIYYLLLNYYDEGPRGPRGPIGLKGIKGVMGLKGQRGFEGPRGPIGNKGPTNFNATSGKQGRMGLRGLKGFQGPRGPRGDDGERGQKGDQGDKGVKGDAGEQGEKGIKGKTARNNKVKFLLLADNLNYEKKEELETIASTADKDLLRPLPGTVPGFNGSFIVHQKGLPIRGVNRNLNWNNFVTGFELKGESITNDRAKGYYSNIQIILPDSK